MNTNDDFGARRFKAALVRQLEPVGIGEDRIHVEYRAYLQDCEVLIDGGELTDEQISLLRDATRFGGCLAFTNAENDARLHRAESRDGQEIMKARAAELLPKLAGLPRFDPRKTTLADFAVEIEVFCGIAPGTALHASDGKTLDVRAQSNVDSVQLQRLMDAITAALSLQDDVSIRLIGMSL